MDEAGFPALPLHVLSSGPKAKNSRGPGDRVPRSDHAQQPGSLLYDYQFWRASKSLDHVFEEYCCFLRSISSAYQSLNVRNK